MPLIVPATPRPAVSARQTCHIPMSVPIPILYHLYERQLLHQPRHTTSSLQHQPRLMPPNNQEAPDSSMLIVNHALPSAGSYSCNCISHGVLSLYHLIHMLSTAERVSGTGRTPRLVTVGANHYH
jgi:hypothetical protein